MSATELGYRVVPITEKDRVVELRRALSFVALPVATALRQRLGELVKEEAAQRAVVARVAREERALDRFGKIYKREDGLIEVREVWL